MFFIPRINDGNAIASGRNKIGKWWGTMLSPEEKERLMTTRYGAADNDATPYAEQQDELIYFNVSGRQFTTTIKTLEHFPESLLGDKQTRDNLPRTKFGEIFLNRSPAVFASVLMFYQTGIFEPPGYVNQNIFVGDIIFYGLEQEALESGLKGFNCTVKPFPKRKWQAYMWNLLEYPDSSLLARIVSIISLLIIILSIVIFCWETIPAYRVKFEELSHEKQTIVTILNQVEIFCITYFTVELVIRFICSPDKCYFVKDILNLIDLVSILPFYATLIFSMDGNVSIYFLRAVRLVRVFRVFKLSRHSSEMKILGIAVKDSGRELGVLVFFILLGVLLFSSAVYYAEGNDKKSKLQSIPGAFWWSIVTMTTVGYGDDVPVTLAGRLVGAVAAMTGILVIAMPIPIIVNNFTRQYQRLKPVSKYYTEFQAKEKEKVAGKMVHGLFSLYDLNEADLLTTQSRSNTPIMNVNNNLHANCHSKTDHKLSNGNITETKIQIESTL